MNAAVTLQSVFDQHLPTYQRTHVLSPPQARVCHHLRQCRTAALGAQWVQCTECAFAERRYHSCRNRHCPQCQGAASAAWCERQGARLLPVTYYHVVFTLPHTLNPWVQLHPEVIYGALFHSVWATMKAFGQRHLGGELGMSAVLHTWGQTLTRHVHLHCLVPGGALSIDGTTWRAARSTYLFPVKALSSRFRGAMVSALRRAYNCGKLSRITAATEVDERLEALMQTDWVVYSKPYLHTPETVVEYLGRYTHRIAISHARLLSVDKAQVSFSYRDYRDRDRQKTMTLSGEEFIRRFLLHVLPKGLMRIRHYGLLANRVREARLEQARGAVARMNALTAPSTTEPSTRKPTTALRCPRCQRDGLRVIAEIPPMRSTGRWRT